MRTRTTWRDSFLFGLLFLLCLSPNAALAYIDPGTGSYMIQILVGAILGGMMSIKIFWRRIVGFVRRIFSSRQSSK